MDYIPTKISELNIGDNIVIFGKMHKVIAKLGACSVELQEYKLHQIALNQLKSKYRTLTGDMIVDKVRVGNEE